MCVYSWGPYILLRGFHPSIMQPCSMHAINLGLLYDVNGSCLKLGCLSCFKYLCVCVRVPCSHVRVQVCPVVSGWPLLKRDILVMLLICRVNLTWPMTPLRRFARLSGFRLPSLPSKWTMLLGFCMPQLVLVYGVKLVLLDFSATMRMKT